MRISAKTQALGKHLILVLLCLRKKSLVLPQSVSLLIGFSDTGMLVCLVLLFLQCRYSEVLSFSGFCFKNTLHILLFKREGKRYMLACNGILFPPIFYRWAAVQQNTIQIHMKLDSLKPCLFLQLFAQQPLFSACPFFFLQNVPSWGPCEICLLSALHANKTAVFFTYTAQASFLRRECFAKF